MVQTVSVWTNSHIIIMITIDRITDHRDAVNNFTTNLMPANITRCIDYLIILFSNVISFKHKMFLNNRMFMHEAEHDVLYYTN